MSPPLYTYIPDLTRPSSILNRLYPAPSSFPLLPLLPQHFDFFAFSFLGFTATEHASRRVGKWMLGKEVWERKFTKKDRQEWGTKCVSMLHCILILPLAFITYNHPSLRFSPIFASDSRVHSVLAISSAYFLWDTLDSLKHSSPGFVLHGISCLFVFLASFRPLCVYFGPAFLLWELSTPFLNLRWFFRKLGVVEKHPGVGKINDLAFAATFFVARIIGGTWNSAVFVEEMWKVREEIPLLLLAGSFAGNLALNGLNYYWFSQIVRKAISGGSSKAKLEKKDLDKKSE